MTNLDRDYLKFRLSQIYKNDGAIAAMGALIYALIYGKIWAEVLKVQTAEERFCQIYKNNAWGSSESRSGPGSTMRSTEHLRRWMVEKLKTYHIKSVVDAPCGDFNWMSAVLPSLDVEYLGVDIVDDLIAQNIIQHSSSRVNFRVGNICDDELPACDLLIVRDCLFHLSFADIDRFLSNIAKVDYRYLLTTTFVVKAHFQNSDIVTGDFRRIDLLKKPFAFPTEGVLERVSENSMWHPAPREMILIRKADVPIQLSGY